MKKTPFDPVKVAASIRAAKMFGRVYTPPPKATVVRLELALAKEKLDQAAASDKAQAAEDDGAVPARPRATVPA